MLDLGKNINDLLYSYDCVIVPGLGGFVANHKNATVNEKTGVFSPPRREIGFNKSLAHNDGLLISHMASSQRISFEDCNKRLAKHVSILKYQLSKGECIDIGNAGELKNDALGNTIFIPKHEESFCRDSFGLSTYQFKTLDQVKAQNESSRRWVWRTLQTKNARQIAASVTLILGMLMVTPEFGNQTQQSTFTDLFPKTEYTIAHPKVDATVIKEAVEDLNKTVQSHNSETEEVLPISAELKNNYFIIGASFKEEHQAQKFLNKLARRGIEGAEIIAANNRYRVSLEGFSDKEMAIKALENHRKTNGFNSAWLLKH
ncbi:Sporulation related domain-containing protein [Saccharicrinis carchari]|uniref:Sporulation related domain-containing protein n=1 Tax=Saccharicrinis carchari TaxID=1168039 RepID=A0A521CCZ9_SACCC|nr:SPOR domain-containing protein [Saccharicrinis carchari]SMO57318.1 Sporulation related domain-containing protein [Saccharicrinis carchari]